MFKVASALMTRPSRALIQLYGIPEAVLREAYGPGSTGEALVRENLRKPRELCLELGILNECWAPLWRWLGLLAPSAA